MKFFRSIAFISLITLVFVEQSVTISLWFGSDKVKLTDVRVITAYAGKMTTGRRKPAVPQLKCIGGEAGCNSYVFETIQCYNVGTDGFDVQWSCKATMDSTYRFGRTDVYCEGYDYSYDPYILKGSCGVEYTLEYSNGGHLMRDLFTYFIWGLACLGIVWLITWIINEAAGSQEKKSTQKPNVDLITKKKSKLIESKPPAPESRIPVRVSSDTQKSEIKLENRPIENHIVHLAAPDINNNIMEDVIVEKVVQPETAKTEIQPLIVQNAILRQLVSVQNERNNIKDFNPGLNVAVGLPSTQENPLPTTANPNNHYIIVNNHNAPVSTTQTNNCQQCSNKSDDIVGDLFLANLILMARARNSKPPPAASTFGTRVVTGFGGTKRR